MMETGIPPIVHGPGAGPRLPALNYFRYVEVLPSLFFVSVDSGDWLFLRREEIHALQHGSFAGDLRVRLERAFVVLTPGNFDEYCQRIAARNFFLKEGPTLHILVVTRECNLSCIYCQASSGPGAKGRMLPATARAAIERAFETPARSLIVEFQGGEPLLNLEAIQAAIERGNELGRETGKRIEYSLISNFTEVVTEDAVRYLIGNRVSLCASLDGPRELHDQNRNRSGCFDRIRENIDLCRRIWDSLHESPFKMRALLTTTRSSLARQREIVDTYVECGIDLLSIRPVTPIGRGRSQRRELAYDAAEFLSFWQDVIEEVLRRRSEGIDLRETHLELFLQKLFANETGHMDIRSPCGAAIGQVVYDFDGGIYTCDEGRMLKDGRFRLGDLSEPLARTVSSVKAREVLDASIAEQYWCDFCAFKPFCGVCPVLHQVSNGDVVGNPVGERRCAIYGGMLRFILSRFATDPVARREFQDILVTSWDR